MKRRLDILVGAIGIIALSYDMVCSFGIVSAVSPVDTAWLVAVSPYLGGPLLSILLIVPRIKAPRAPRRLMLLNTFSSGVLVLLGTLLALCRHGLLPVKASHMSTAVLLFYVCSFLSSGLFASGLWFSLEARGHTSRLALMYKRFSCRRHEVEEPNPIASVTVLSDMLLLQGLSPREAAVVASVYGGGSSFQIAEDLGVKPPTVRTYLQRAYKKLGISSAEELQKVISDLTLATGYAVRNEGTDSNAHGSKRTFETARCRRLVWAHGCFTASLLLSLLVECGHGAISLPACAMPALLFGSAAIAVGIRFQRRLSVSSIVVCSGVLTVYVAARLREILLITFFGSNWPNAVLLLFASLCTLSRWLSAADVISPLGPENARDSLARAVSLLAIPTLWILSNATPMCWMFTVLLEMAVLGVIEHRLIALRVTADPSVVGCRSVNEGGARKYDFSIPHAVFVASGVVFGFLWIELLTPGAVYPFSEYEVPIVVPLVFAAVLAIAANENQGLQWLVPTSAFFSLILLWFIPLVSGWMTAGATAAAFVVHIVLIAIQRDSCLRRRACASLATGVTLGLCIGCYLVAFNRFSSDAALSGLFPAHGASELTFRTFLFGGLSFGASVVLLYCAYCSIHDGHRDMAPEMRDAIRAYLHGRGLSKLQTEVVILIMAGSTGPSIARDLSYSLGSVNHARREAYRLLDVHEVKSLKDLIRRDVPAAQDL